MPIVRDLKGEIVPVGKTYRKLEENFLGVKTIPSWMINSSGSYTISTTETTQGYLQLSTGANLDDKAEIRFLGGINMNYIREIVLKLDSLYFSHGDATIDIHISMQSNTNTGVSFSQRYSGHMGDAPELMRFIARKNPDINTEKRINYILAAKGEYKRRKNLSFHLRSDRTVYMMENDVVVAMYRFSDAEMDLDEPVVPRIIIQTKEAGTAVSMYVSRVELGIWHN